MPLRYRNAVDGIHFGFAQQRRSKMLVAIVTRTYLRLTSTRIYDCKKMIQKCIKICCDLFNVFRIYTTEIRKSDVSQTLNGFWKHDWHITSR
jgi:hypothetical protein